jgi:signal transduction histidine kinase
MTRSDDPATVPRANILLVDDQPDNLLALEAVLEDLGQNLVSALSGVEALRHLLARDFAVILLDVKMQGMDGFETAKLIRSRKRSRQTPIIFLTAYESSDFSVAEAYKLGAVDYLVKPLVPPILRAKVAGFVELYQKTEEVKRQAEQLRELERREFERRLAQEKQAWELERLRAVAAREKKIAQDLAELDRRKDEFLAMLGHELRNPLAPIRNAVHILSLVGIDHTAAEQARKVIERQVKHMTRLVDDLLDVSRIAHGKILLHKERVDLRTAVGHGLETCRPLIEARGHALEVTLPPQPVWAEADPARLEQVVVNLLTNAAKYTEPGGRICLTMQPTPREAVLRVRDTGVGIPPEQLERVFDLFTQVDRSISSPSQWGLGIGLSLVRRLVELHGGTVTAASAGRGQGSEFTVRLPILVPDANPAPDARLNGPAAAGPGRKVLVIDDNVDLAESLATLLRLEGHTVQTVHEGQAALATARTSRPEVVLLDLGLPGVDGYEVARQLRKQPELEGVVLVALTGYGQEEDRRRCREAGFDHHLIKPADPEELKRLLRQG